MYNIILIIGIVGSGDLSLYRTCRQFYFKVYVTVHILELTFSKGRQISDPVTWILHLLKYFFASHTAFLQVHGLNYTEWYYNVGKQVKIFVLLGLVEMHSTLLQGCGSAFILCGSGSSSFSECGSGSRSRSSLTKFEEKKS